jgi:polyisoprenoid-binding protein YceI
MQFQTKINMGLLIGMLSMAASAAVVPNNQPIAVNMSITQMGVPMKGAFSKATITGTIPDQGAGNVAVVLQTGSLSGISQEAISAAKGKNWLDAQSFPTATFKTNNLQVNAGKGTATGMLTIKGITKPATATFTVQGNKVNGQLTFDRTQFQIGTGEWASTSVIAAPVKIEFSI